MKTKLLIVAVLSAMTMSVMAQSFAPARVANEPIQSQPMMTGGSYSGTVYEPFSNVAPSEYNSGNGSYSPAKAPGGPRKGFDHGAETGQSNESPIGDAMWPLMLLACAYLSMRVFLKKKRAMKE